MAENSLKIKQGYIMREIAGSSVVVPVGERVVDFKGIMTLSGIAPFIWGILMEGSSREALYDKVLEAYEVERERAVSEINELLDEMSRLGLLES